MVDIEFSHDIYRSAGVKPTKISGVTTKRECQPPTMTDFTNAKKKQLSGTTHRDLFQYQMVLWEISYCDKH